TETTTPETVVPHVMKLRFRSAARRWEWLQLRVQTWRDREGEPRYEIKERSSTAQVHPVIDEPIYRSIPLILARLVHHDDTICNISYF
ncbi:hypothetical protein Tco_0447700, partial [Tanacetum coccineum]